MRSIRYTQPGPYQGSDSTRGGVHIASDERDDNDRFVSWVDASSVEGHRFEIAASDLPISLSHEEAQALRNAITGWLVNEGVERDIVVTTQ